MTITKDRKTGVYKARFRTAQGKVRVATTRTTNLQEAKQVVQESHLKELELAAKSGRLMADVIGRIVSGKKVTIQKAVEEWVAWMGRRNRSALTIYPFQCDVLAWARDASLLNAAPAAITEGQIADWINNPARTTKRSRRARQLSSLRSFFGFCSANGYCAGDPSQLVEVDQSILSHAQKEAKPRHPFTDAEVRLILSKTEAGSWWHSAVAISRWTGLRLGDICKLEWDVLSVPGFLSVWTEKRDKRVQLPLEPGELVMALSAIPPRDRQYLFPEEQKTAENPTRRSNFSVQFGRLLHALGIQGKSFHDLRSSYISDCAARGITMEHIAKAVGHSSVFTTMGYLGRKE